MLVKSDHKESDYPICESILCTHLSRWSPQTPVIPEVEWAMPLASDPHPTNAKGREENPCLGFLIGLPRCRYACIREALCESRVELRLLNYNLWRPRAKSSGPSRGLFHRCWSYASRFRITAKCIKSIGQDLEMGASTNLDDIFFRNYFRPVKSLTCSSMVEVKPHWKSIGYTHLDIYKVMVILRLRERLPRWTLRAD